MELTEPVEKGGSLTHTARCVREPGNPPLARNHDPVRRQIPQRVVFSRHLQEPYLILGEVAAVRHLEFENRSRGQRPGNDDLSPGRGRRARLEQFEALRPH